MIRIITFLILFMSIYYNAYAKDRCDVNCRESRAFCGIRDNSEYFWDRETYFINKNTKIVELVKFLKDCSSGKTTAIAETCYTIFYKLDNEWIPISISCIPRNYFIFKGYIEDIVKVKVKDKKGRVSIKEVIKNQKRIRMEAKDKKFMFVKDYKDIEPDKLDVYYSLDELKKAGYTIIEILDKKKKEKK